MVAGFDERELLNRYVAAFERADMDGLVALLREDATLRMPPESLAGARIPQGQHFVASGRREQHLVMQSDTTYPVDPVLMALESEQAHSGFGIPDAEGVVG